MVKQILSYFRLIALNYSVSVKIITELKIENRI